MRTEVSLLALAAALGAAPVLAQTAPTPAEVEEVIVTGQRGAIAKARDEERRADNLTNVVSADSVGQFGDQNTAEALQRLPGVNIERNEGEGRTVSIRGLPSSFTQVTVNGARVGTSEAGDSTVALDVIPSDLLGRIIVSKTYTPEMDGDTIGGSVELQSISAFGQAEDLTAFRAEGSYNAYSEKWGPKVSGSLARRFMDGTLGVAASASYFQRDVEGDDLRNEVGLLSLTRGGQTYLYPGEVNQRFEVGDRERYGGTLNLEYRPTDDARYFLRGQFSQLNDDDTRVQQIWQTERSTGNEIVEIADGSGRFNDVRLRYQTFFQPTEDRLWTVSGGGENVFGPWTLSYQVDFSRSNWSQEDGVRGRFQIDDLQQRLSWTVDSADTTLLRQSSSRPNPADLGAYAFSALLFIEEERVDEITSVRFDLQRDVQVGGRPAYVKFGGKIRQRDKTADKAEFNADNPADLTYEDTPLFTPRTRFIGFGPFPELGFARDLYLRTRDDLLSDPEFQNVLNSFASDYRLGEDVTAAYLMGAVDLSPTVKLIGGVRLERTEFDSQGYFIETDEDGGSPSGGPLVPIDLGTYQNSYDTWLPSLLLRWEPGGDWVARLSYGRGLKRPDFEDAVNQQQVSYEEDEDDDGNPIVIRELSAGNPFLKPLIADQFDASVAWYPNRHTVLQVAAFHKEIRDFFIDFETDNLGATPLRVPTGVSTDFRSVETIVNGAKASVTGVELSYSQSFVQLPGLLSGFFAEANVTFADSEAEIAERAGESFPFPGQAEVSGNLSLGWENEAFSLRFAANHRGEVLAGVSGSDFSGTANEFPEDRYRKAYTQFDVNLRWNATDRVQVYFDGINLTDEKDTRFYRGDRVEFFERVQDFGATYQAGVRLTF